MKKVVTGAVPPGTTFIVSVVCSFAPAATGSASTTSTTGTVHADPFSPAPMVITFDAQGDPTTPGSNVLPVFGGSNCTVTEESPFGGAQSVSYGCTSTSSNVVCETNQQTVQFLGDNTTGENATVTVTNAFPPQPVVVSPQFTG